VAEMEVARLVADEKRGLLSCECKILLAVKQGYVLPDARKFR
jgi:hypothetical protein